MTLPRELLSLRAILKTHVVAVNCCQSAKTAGMSVTSYRMNRLTEPRNIDEVANLATQQQSQILFRVFPQCWCGWHSGVPRMKIVLTRSQAGQMVYDACRFRCQKEKIRVEADRGFVAAAVRVVVGVGADDKCGETQHQVVREIHGRTEQPVSLWTPERRPGDSD